MNDKHFYKRYTNLLTRVKSLAKKLFYFYEFSTFKNNPKKTWEVLRSILSSKSASSAPNIINIDGKCFTNPSEIAEKFNHHFANVGKSLVTKQNNVDDEKYLSYSKSFSPSSIYLKPTDPYEIKCAINKLSLSKASGYDDILPFFLKTAADIVAFPLANIINKCISFGIFPNRLKVAKAIPVYKSGPADSPENYRPISLLSSLSKIFERIILNKMISFFEQNNILISTQFGFRHNHSTLHPILDSNLKKIEYGVPQGSILGPLLFLIFINDLPKCLHSVPRLFADDTALLISDSTLPKMEKLANDELSNVNQWMRSNNLTLHPQKTLALYISPYSRKSSPNLTLTLDADQISISDAAKYLGLLVDDQLSFKNHIALLENKISRSVGIMYKLSYYLPSNTLLLLYYSLIHTQLMHVLSIWASTFPTYLIKHPKENTKQRIKNYH